jgi:hypothetical protein
LVADFTSVRLKREPLLLDENEIVVLSHAKLTETVDQIVPAVWS